jgi:hypothetical protein
MRTYYKIESRNEEILVMDNNGVISFVPEDPSNSDYQAYLKSLEDEA